jgi:hypothetical protein
MRFEEAWEIAALAQLRNAKRDRSGACLPIPVAVAAALSQPHRILLAVASTGRTADLQLHQPLGRKADHHTQQIGVGTLLNKRAHVHHIVGHRWSFHQVGVEQPDPTGKHW